MKTYFVDNEILGKFESTEFCFSGIEEKEVD